MLDFVLRVLLLSFCVGAILTSIQLAVWTAKPWWKPLLRARQETAVTIEPVGIIESGKVKDVESGPIASQLRHRLMQVSEALSRDLSESYAVLQKAGVSIPRTSVEGSETFQLMADTEVSFEVEVFKFDIAGLLKFINGRLDARDSVKTMIELSTPKSRLFLDVSRVNGAPQRLIIDSGPSLNEAIDVAACAVMQAYREKDGLFAGLDAHGFCAFLKVLETFQAFIIQSANGVELGGQMDVAKARAIAAQLEADPFAPADSPVIHLILASLYRLQGESAAALKRLEQAAKLAPQHEFVVANIVTWRKEVAEQEAQARLLAEAKSSPPAAGELDTTYASIRSQAELAQIKYPQMLERLQSLPARKDVVVAVFTTGFTEPAHPAPLPEILPALSTVDEPGTDDKNGHGNMTTHLLAALLPRERLKILPMKVLADSGAGSTSEILKGFELAATSGADILAIPLGMDASGKSAAGTARIYEATLDGLNVIAIAAAGNSARRSAGFNSAVALPASLPKVVAVGGTAAKGAWADFSPGPDGVDVAAPAVQLLTSLTGSETRETTGTSFSTVIVAALFALARSVNPELGQAEILTALQETSVANPSGGPATIDALAFIDRIAQGTPPLKPERRTRQATRLRAPREAGKGPLRRRPQPRRNA